MLTKFKVPTVSFKLSFSSSVYDPHALHLGHKSKGKKQGSITYSTVQADAVSKISLLFV